MHTVIKYYSQTNCYWNEITSCWIDIIFNMILIYTPHFSIGNCPQQSGHFNVFKGSQVQIFLTIPTVNCANLNFIRYLINWKQRWECFFIGKWANSLDCLVASFANNFLMHFYFSTQKFSIIKLVFFITFFILFLHLNHWLTKDNGPNVLHKIYLVFHVYLISSFNHTS